MPLQRSGSKQAFRSNVAAEVNAGRPRDQALAIAYAVKRRNRYLGGRLNRAEGGDAFDDTPLFLQSGLTEMPPEVPELTRALPDYASRGPGELAMLRHREMVRPQAGRADFPMEHVANMATAGLMMTPAGYALAPEMAAGRAIAAGAQYAPRLTTAGLAGVGALAPSMTEGAENQQASLPKDPQAIMELQTKLRAAGYPVQVDGIMRPGGETEKAFQQFQQAEATRRAEQLKRQELETQQGANQAALETARANAATAEAKREADRLAAEQEAARLARKQAGDERMREIEKNISPMSRVIRDYSGPVGMGIGAVAGGLSRYGMQSLANKTWRENAAAADALMTSPAKGTSAAAIASRVAKANEFWRRGNGEVPFLLNAEKAPGYTINPKAAPLDKLYNPQIHPIAEAAGMAPPLVEEEVSRHYRGKAEEELAKAQEAAAVDPSEINIQRIQAAKDNVALYTGLQRVGQVWGTTQGLGAVGSRFLPKSPDLRPNKAAAEQEQAALQKILRDIQEKATKKSAASAPRQVASPLPGGPPLTAEAVRARKKIPEQAHGGGIRSPLAVAYAIRRQKRADGGAVHAGPILSSVPGRTDNHPMDVASGAYVMPAEAVSHLGENNTAAGMEVLNSMFGPGGSLAGDYSGDHSGAERVPINAAGGEFVIAPEVVMAIGGGDIARGHKMLDEWVLLNRKKHIKTLKGLPGPAKS